MKHFLKQWAPGLYCAIANIKRHLALHFSLARRLRSMRRLDALVLGELHARIVQGPFRGLHYIHDCPGVACKVLGTYERELHPVLESLLETPYECVVNIGCAEGYYAVGWAYRTREVAVHAYDINQEAQRLVSKLAQLNKVADRVQVRGECDHIQLEQFSDRRVLVICDIEGAEVDLLDPKRAPSLAMYDLLVELHDGPTSTRIKDVLLDRFQPTHTPMVYRYAGRSVADCPPLRSLATPEARQRAVDEHRYLGLEWAFFRSNAKNPQGSASREVNQTCKSSS